MRPENKRTLADMFDVFASMSNLQDLRMSCLLAVPDAWEAPKTSYILPRLRSLALTDLTRHCQVFLQCTSLPQLQQMHLSVEDYRESSWVDLVPHVKAFCSQARERMSSTFLCILLSY